MNLGWLRTGFRHGMRRRNRLVTETKAWAAMIMAWVGITQTATNYFDPGITRVIPPALQAVTTTVGLWRPIPYAGPIVGILGSALYAVVGFISRFGLDTFLSLGRGVSREEAMQGFLTAAPGLVTV